MNILQGLYDNAPGYVEKIDLKWSVIEASNNYGGALAAVATADAAYEAAIKHAKKVLEMKKKAEKAAKEAAEAAAAQGLPVEPRTTPPTGPTTTPPPPTVVPGKRLAYWPVASFPRGAAANPFMEEI